MAVKIGKILGLAPALVLALGMSTANAEEWGAGSWDDKGGKGGGAANWGGAGAMGFGEGHMTARLRAIWKLDLTAEQKVKIRAIQKDLRAKHWELEDKIDEASDELMGMYKFPKRDPQAIGKVYGKIFDYRRQMIELAVDAGNKAGDVLTTEQWKEWQKKMPHAGGWGKAGGEGHMKHH